MLGKDSSSGNQLGDLGHKKWSNPGNLIVWQLIYLRKKLALTEYTLPAKDYAKEKMDH